MILQFFNGVWVAEDVNVVLLYFGPSLPSKLCLGESWIIGRRLCKSCIDRDICADPGSKQYVVLGIVHKQLPADVTF